VLGDFSHFVLLQNECCITMSLTPHIFFLLLQVPKLIEGRDYIIRIMAKNIYGISDPLLSAESKARDIFSRFTSKLLIYSGGVVKSSI